jgi:cytochrome bd-type quinol oxidase subunit 1
MSISHFGLTSITLFLITLLYLIPIIAIIYWMVRMLKNANEQTKLQREILEKLNNKP